MRRATSAAHGALDIILRLTVETREKLRGELRSLVDAERERGLAHIFGFHRHRLSVGRRTDARNLASRDTGPMTKR